MNRRGRPRLRSASGATWTVSERRATMADTRWPCVATRLCLPSTAAHRFDGVDKSWSTRGRRAVNLSTPGGAGPVGLL